MKTPSCSAVVCPYCKARIEPEEQIRVSSNQIRCPWCESCFASGTRDEGVRTP